MYDVITVGSSTVDVFAKVNSELIKIKTALYEQEFIAYPCGTKILMDDLDMYTGGGGTNTAVALARLKLKVAYLGKIGSGSHSSIIVNSLKKDRVEFIGVNSKRHHAGYSVILESLEGDRTILAFKGANNYLGFDEIDIAKLQTSWFYFSSMVDRSYETQVQLATYAKEKGIKLAFNPSNYLAEKGAEFLNEILSRTDLLVLNKEEAILLVGRKTIANLIRALMHFGPTTVVVTDGKQGAYTMKGNALYHVIPRKVDVVETTGAGDAFAATFLAMVAKGKDISTCLRMSLLNSESVIQHRGAKEGLLSYVSLSKKLKDNPPHVEISTI